MHKHRPLVKPVLITASDGYIITVVCPYLANANDKNNDDGITCHTMRHNTEQIISLYQERQVYT